MVKVRWLVGWLEKVKSTKEPSLVHSLPLNHLLEQVYTMEGREGNMGTDQQRMDMLFKEMERRKEQANEIYRAKQFEDAFDRYQTLLHDLDKVTTEEDSTHHAEVTPLRAILHLNLAACALEMKRYQETVEHCTRVLQVEPSNAKASYRMGKAYYLLKRYDKADYYLRDSLTHTERHHALSKDDRDGIPMNFNNSNKIMRDVRIMLQNIDAQKKRKNRFRGMFDRVELYGDRKLPKRLIKGGDRWFHYLLPRRGITIALMVAFLTILLVIYVAIRLANK